MKSKTDMGTSKITVIIFNMVIERTSLGNTLVLLAQHLLGREKAVGCVVGEPWDYPPTAQYHSLMTGKG